MATDGTPDGSAVRELQPCTRFEWERIVRRCRIGRDVKHVAYVLAQYGDYNGNEIRPGVERLAAVCEMGERTVKRHLATLLGLGLVERLTKGGGRNARAALYRLSIPTDLLERVEMLGPDEGAGGPRTAPVRDRNSGQIAGPSRGIEPVDNQAATPVENPSTGATQMAPVEEPEPAPTGAIQSPTGANPSTYSGHLGGPPPRRPTKDQTKTSPEVSTSPVDPQPPPRSRSPARRKPPARTRRHRRHRGAA